MAKVKNSGDIAKLRPALTPEAEETQCIALAYTRAKEQLANGTASSQVITHFLKAGYEREKRELELERLEEENKLLRAKTEQLQAQKDSSEVYKEVLIALKKYNGYGSEDDEDYDDYDTFDEY